MDTINPALIVNGKPFDIRQVLNKLCWRCSHFAEACEQKKTNLQTKSADVG
jgi:hypothetical protein